jgi:ubiquinone/menaquinone biosynthesis C-methylase UbiE
MNSDEKDFKFDKKAATYDEGFAGKASRKFYNLILREIEAEQGAAVLDVGCGTGALLNKIADTHEIKAHGIDTEENMIDVAKSKHPDMDFQLSPCENIPFGNQTFDILIACMAYHHFADKKGFAKEAARVLKPGGVLYIADPRFPWVVRKTFNGILRCLKIVGAFFKPQEIINDFAPYGFEGYGVAADGYAQIVKLKLRDKKSCCCCSGGKCC